MSNIHKIAVHMIVTDGYRQILIRLYVLLRIILIQKNQE